MKLQYLTQAQIPHYASRRCSSLSPSRRAQRSVKHGASVRRPPPRIGSGRSSAGGRLRFRCVSERPQPPRWKDWPKGSESVLRASVNTRVFEGAAGGCCASLDDDRFTLSSWWHPSQSVFSTVLQDQRDRVRQALASFLLRSPLAVGPRNLRTVCNPPLTVTLENGRKLIRHRRLPPVIRPWHRPFNNSTLSFTPMSNAPALNGGRASAGSAVPQISLRGSGLTSQRVSSWNTRRS